MTTNFIREAIRDRLDPIIEEIITREISDRGPAYQMTQDAVQQQLFEALAPILLSTLPQQQQQSFGVIAPILLPMLMQQQSAQQPLASVLPVLLTTQRQQQQPLGALMWNWLSALMRPGGIPGDPIYPSVETVYRCPIGPHDVSMYVQYTPSGDPFCEQHKQIMKRVR